MAVTERLVFRYRGTVRGQMHRASRDLSAILRWSDKHPLRSTFDGTDITAIQGMVLMLQLKLDEKMYVGPG